MMTIIITYSILKKIKISIIRHLIGMQAVIANSKATLVISFVVIDDIINQLFQYKLKWHIKQ